MSGIFKLAFGIVIVVVLIWWFISDHDSNGVGSFDFQTTGYEEDADDSVGDSISERVDGQKSLPNEYSGQRLPDDSNTSRDYSSEDAAPLDDGVRGMEQPRERFEDLSPSEFVDKREKELNETISNYHRILSDRRR